MGTIFNVLEKSKTDFSEKELSGIIKEVAKNNVTDISDIQAKKNDNQYTHSNINKNLLTLLKPFSFETEQFKLLRSNLMFSAAGKAVRSIMITSAMPGEGKSFVSANLAISIAQNIDQHVLLMDCDLRKPNQHKLFGFGKVSGLSEYLSQGVTLSSVLLKSAEKKLTILAAGKVPRNPAELLSSEQMAKLLHEVKARYSNRYIIIDSPPPNFSPESKAIASQVDGIIVVVRNGGTNKKHIEDMIDIIGKEKIIGVVLNRFDTPYFSTNTYKQYGKYGIFPWK